MSQQSVGRSQGPKRVTVKTAFQFTVFLAICIWLLYQMKHSLVKKKDYAAVTLENELKGEHRSIRLGGKENAWSIPGAEMEEDGTDIENGKKEVDGGGGDDELERADEEEAILKGYEGLQNFPNQDVKEDMKAPRTQQKESQKIEDLIDRNGAAGSGKKAKAYKKNIEENIINLEEKEGIEEILKKQMELQSNEKDDIDSTVRYGDEGIHLDKDYKESAEEAAMSPAKTNVSVITSEVSKGTGINGFHDENGVPEDGHELINTLTSETKGDDKTHL